MAWNADTIILTGIALVLAVLIWLFVAIWRGMRTKRLLAQLRERARLHEEQMQAALSDARLEIHGQSIALEQAQLQHREKLRDIETQKREQQQLHLRLNEALTEQARLQTQQREREHQHAEQIKLLSETRDNLKREFENLANKIFEDKGRHFTTTSQASLEALLKPFREQISGFQTRINEVHAESIKGNTLLEKEIQKVLDVGLEMNSQASNLTSALKGDKKTAGNWGEAQLERTLELAGLQAGEHYETQAAFLDEKGKRRRPDFIIRLPDGKNLVIDSKVSLVDYDRAIAADTDEARDDALTRHSQAVRNHIDDLAGKDYANLSGMSSPDFVLMFMPIEPAYIEAMKHNKDLFNYGYQKGVIMVSHTTLMPILRTVANLWMIEQSNKEAQEISTRAGDIYNQVCRVAERLEKLGGAMRNANNHYNDALTSLVGKQGLYGKIDRFAQLSAKANKTMPALDPIEDDIETGRLVALTQGEDGVVADEIAEGVEPTDKTPSKSSDNDEGELFAEHASEFLEEGVDDTLDTELENSTDNVKPISANQS